MLLFFSPPYFLLCMRSRKQLESRTEYIYIWTAVYDRRCTPMLQRLNVEKQTGAFLFVVFPMICIWSALGGTERSNRVWRRGWWERGRHGAFHCLLPPPPPPPPLGVGTQACGLPRNVLPAGKGLPFSKRSSCRQLPGRRRRPQKFNIPPLKRAGLAGSGAEWRGRVWWGCSMWSGGPVGEPTLGGPGNGARWLCHVVACGRSTVGGRSSLALK